MKLSPAIFAAILLPAGAYAQVTMPKDNNYDVVSIKAAAPSDATLILPQGLQTTFRGFSLKSLMVQAFGVHEQDLIGLPKWAETERFTIVAKAKAPLRDQMDRWSMLQRVFQVRFALQYHPEKRPASVYVVTAAAGGIRLPVTAPGSCVAIDPAGGPPPMPPTTHKGGPNPNGSEFCEMYLGRGVPPDGLRLMVKGAPMPHLVRYLEHSFDRPLLDETGSDKKYDVDISYLRNNQPSTAEVDAPSGLPTITAALKKVGILVTPKRELVDVIVIDRLERPSAN